jgi:hypothetical protein
MNSPSSFQDDTGHDIATPASDSRMKNSHIRNMKLPDKLHLLLEYAEHDGKTNIISWMPGNISFKVHDKKTFVDTLMPRFFQTSNYKSFQRNLNLWGFETVSKGSQKGVRSHPLFVRDNPQKCHLMTRVVVKGWNNATTPQQQTTREIPSDPRVLAVSTSSSLCPTLHQPVISVSSPGATDTGSSSTRMIAGSSVLGLSTEHPQVVHSQNDNFILSVFVANSIQESSHQHHPHIMQMMAQQQRELAPLDFQNQYLRGASALLNLNQGRAIFDSSESTLQRELITRLLRGGFLRHDSRDA